MPNADRDWNAEFNGELAYKKKRSTSANHVEIEYNERNFEEGADELSLIDDVEGFASKEKSVISWNKEDDNLLRTLFIDRQCSLSVIASVFDKDESDIKKRLIELNLIQ